MNKQELSNLFLQQVNEIYYQVNNLDDRLAHLLDRKEKLDEQELAVAINVYQNFHEIIKTISEIKISFSSTFKVRSMLANEYKIDCEIPNHGRSR